MFVEHVINVWKQFGVKDEGIAIFVNDNVKRVFQAAFDEGFLYKAEHYAYWVTFMNHNY